MTVVNPLQAAIEFWLAIYNAFPLPFRAFLNLTFAFMAASAVISLIFRSK